MKHIGYFLYFKGEPIYLDDSRDDAEFDVLHEEAEPDFFSHSVYEIFCDMLNKKFPNHLKVSVYVEAPLPAINFRQQDTTCVQL